MVTPGYGVCVHLKKTNNENECGFNKNVLRYKSDINYNNYNIKVLEDATLFVWHSGSVFNFINYLFMLRLS